MDFHTIQPRHWQNPSLTWLLFISFLYCFFFFPPPQLLYVALFQPPTLGSILAITFSHVWGTLIKYFKRSSQSLKESLLWKKKYKCNKNYHCISPMREDTFFSIWTKTVWGYPGCQRNFKLSCGKSVAAICVTSSLVLWCLVEQQRIIIMSEQTQLKWIKQRLTVPKFCFSALKVSPTTCVTTECLACNTVSCVRVIRRNQQWTRWVSKRLNDKSIKNCSISI